MRPVTLILFSVLSACDSAKTPEAVLATSSGDLAKESPNKPAGKLRASKSLSEDVVASDFVAERKVGPGHDVCAGPDAEYVSPKYQGLAWIEAMERELASGGAALESASSKLPLNELRARLERGRLEYDDAVRDGAQVTVAYTLSHAATSEVVCVYASLTSPRGVHVDLITLGESMSWPCSGLNCAQRNRPNPPQ